MSSHLLRRLIPGRCSLTAVLRALPELAVLLAALLLVAQPLLTQAATGSGRTVIVANIDGTITPVMARYVERAIKRAERDQAAALVLQMDTPGGLSTAMDDIIRSILESEVPVVVYVAPRGARAASAGVFITYAAHIAAMAPGTNIGSATPIFLGEDGSAQDGSATLQRKVTNDAVSQIKNLAQLRGRNAEWAEKAVREAANITADEAAALHVVDLLAPDLPSLLAAIDGRTVQMASGTMTLATKDATTRALEMTVFEEFLQLIADPTIAYLLLSLGLLGIWIELSNPGITLPGVAGAISLILGLFALGTLSVNWTGVLLIALAFVLLILDLFVPSLGLLTIGGLVSFVIGSYLLFGDEAAPGYEVSRTAIWALTACLLAFALFLGWSVMRARFRPPATGKETLAGQIGEVRSPLAPSGMVRVQGELWRATLEEGSPPELPVGAQVVVTRVDGLRLVVRPATDEDLRQVTSDKRRIIGDRREVVPVREPAPAPIARTEGSPSAS